MIDNKLAGRVALITGGSSGIGLASAKLFKAQGASVIIVGRDATSLERARSEIGGDTLAVVADVSKVAEIEFMIAKVKATHGKIDILFANAGMSECPPIEETTVEFFDQITDVNLKGVFFTFTKALPLFKNGASVIFTCSVAHGKGKPGDPLYSATKAAVRSLARTLAAEDDVLGRGIRVNVVSPGAIKTPLTSRSDPAEEEQINAYIESVVPMKRWGLAEEVAKAVLFLACDDSSYMTGGEVTVDGGLGQN